MRQHLPGGHFTEKVRTSEESLVPTFRESKKNRQIAAA
jgi:hypothetical protein